MVIEIYGQVEIHHQRPIDLDDLTAYFLRLENITKKTCQKVAKNLPESQQMI